jgi:hypothetical protein
MLLFVFLLLNIKEKTYMNVKKCSVCVKEKNISEFYQTKFKGKLKIKSCCKVCLREQERKKYFEENKEKILNKKPFDKNKYSKEYYQKNKKDLLEKVKNYAHENKEVISIRAKKYYQKNKESILRKIKSKRLKINEYVRNRRKANLNIRLAHNLRTRIKSLIKSNGKCLRLLELIGCTIEEFKLHLEKQFKDGMTWKNYGKVWHVDHIKPCSLFNLVDQEQQKICFHYTNLQPLLAEENFKKSDSYVEEQST